MTTAARKMQNMRFLVSSDIWPLVVAAAINAVALTPLPAIAEDGAECFTKAAKINVCELAREGTAKLVSGLPVRLNKNITLSTAFANEKSIEISVFWHIRKSEADALLTSGGISYPQLANKMGEAMKNSICSNVDISAFIRLGGSVVYKYATEDGFNVMSYRVESCR